MPHDFQLQTERLILRPPQMNDAPAIQRYCGDWELARNTLNIPHPYRDGLAEQFLEEILQSDDPNVFQFSLTLCDTGEMIGLMSIIGDERHRSAEVGYWIGKPFWGQGYASEALISVVQFGFEQMKLNRIFGQYYSYNIASRRVMEKAGMIYEGTLRQHTYHWEQFFDLGICAILRQDWQPQDLS